MVIIPTRTILSSSGETLTNVKTIFSTDGAFAALKENNSVVTWGDNDGGGVSTAGSTYGIPTGATLDNVKTIFSTEMAFAALKKNNSVVTWGKGRYGGDLGKVYDSNTPLSTDYSGSLSSDVKTIFSTERAFAALKQDGSVVTWGENSYGGDSTTGTTYGIPSGATLYNVKTIFSTEGAFAALKDDGSVVTGVVTMPVVMYHQV